MIAEHIEKFVGRISYGTLKDKFDKVNIVIVCHEPDDELNTFVTLGLHRHDVNYKSRFELVFVCSNQIHFSEITSFLSWFANLIIQTQKPLLRGQVVFLPRNIGESTMNALYIETPFYFDENFQTMECNGNKIIFPLLIPLYECEAKLIESKGWQEFESFLHKGQIDNLYDLNRQSFYW